MQAGRPAEGEFPPRLAQGEVHLWRIDLGGPFPVAAQRSLAAAEVARAARFHFQRDRDRFLHARYAMRQLLARYLDLPPALLPLVFNPHGKPLLDATFELGFNLSHSGDHALLAVSRAPEVGVDLEERTPRSRLRELACSVFTRDEMRALDACTPDEQLTAFLSGWTRKEAYLKALGVGLTVEPSMVHAGLDPARRRIPVVGDLSGGFVEVESVRVHSRCLAAIAVRGGFGDVRLHDLADWRAKLETD